METPSINHPTGRPNFTEVNVGDRTFWFSYRTCVAFMDPGHGRIVRRNEWAQTTGKHLNEVDGGSAEAKARRVDVETFQRLLGENTDGSVSLDPRTWRPAAAV